MCHNQHCVQREIDVPAESKHVKGPAISSDIWTTTCLPCGEIFEVTILRPGKTPIIRCHGISPRKFLLCAHRTEVSGPPEVR